LVSLRIADLSQYRLMGLTLPVFSDRLHGACDCVRALRWSIAEASDRAIAAMASTAIDDALPEKT
jgi:hypothetical protein